MANFEEKNLVTGGEEVRRRRGGGADNAKKKLKLATSSSNVVVVWPCAAPVSLEAERLVLSVALRWERETGMFQSQPAWRLSRLERACVEADICISQALSLRRQHIMRRNRCRTFEQLGLGSQPNVLEAATLFEAAIKNWLSDSGAAFQTEDQQRATNGKGSRATPDFLMLPDRSLTIAGRPVRWIEAKHFYGAATIPQDGKSASGKIASKAAVYAKTFGPGAFCFAYGVAADLAAELDRVGVLALDATPLDLTRLEVQLRGWCANKDGKILP